MQEMWVWSPGSGRSPGGGHGNPLQHSCLENPMGRGPWQATIHSFAKSWTWLSNGRATATTQKHLPFTRCPFFLPLAPPTGHALSSLILQVKKLRHWKACQCQSGSEWWYPGCLTSKCPHHLHCLSPSSFLPGRWSLDMGPKLFFQPDRISQLQL